MFKGMGHVGEKILSGLGVYPVFALVLISALLFWQIPVAAAEKGPYDPNTDIRLKINQAVEVAQKADQHILLVFGANWCPWCRALHQLFQSNKKVHRYLEENYQLVLVDIGRRDNNMEIDSIYGNPTQYGIPALVVLDETGKELTVQETGSLETKDTSEKGHSPDKVLGFLRRWDHPLESEK